ncbi:hypothetical protein [Sphingobium yanoikuyae]|uniref:Bacteriophage tail tape measure N-terminal domain-containing protein n=1 Tax=Sphingobium yanoikuyae TaxID=13690 RepID=A0A9X7YEA3_SPHYA|nr:hypothetical protein [Sphingobium yanoikuyae]QNG47427.1 hypothetical protein H3V42_07405 [Sphingobium yanoikuyae]
MSLKTSLIITGDSATAQAAVNALTDAVNKTGKAAADTAAPADAMGKAVDGIADSAEDAAGAIGALDGAIGDIAGSAADAAGTSEALGGALDDIGTGARNAGKDAGFLGSILSDASGAIKDAISGALGLDGALDSMGGATQESSKLAGELEGKLGDMAKGALESSAAQGAIAKASGVAATAMSGFGVSAATVEAILTGGLSLALTAVIGFLSGFAAEALSGSDALGQQEDAAASLTEQIDALNKALERETQTQYTARVETLNHAEAQRTLAVRTIEARKALLEKAIAEQKQVPGWSPVGGAQAIQQAASMSANAAVADLQAQVAEAEAALVKANKAVSGSRQYFVDRGVQAATDPRARATLTFDQGLDRLDRRRNQISETQYARERAQLERERAAALDAVSEAEKKASASGKSLSNSRSAASAADRAAAEATKKLQAELEGVIGRYDPARKAAADYAEELERIAKLKDAGKISADDAANYRAQASAAYLSKAIDVSGIKELAEQEQAAIAASGAIDKIVQSINDETAALGVLNPVQRELLNYRQQLAALSPEERAAAEARIAGALAEKNATQEVARATEEARRAQEQLGNMAVDAFTAIVAGGQKASDVIGRLAETIAAAAIQATLFGTGPLAAMLNGASLPSTGGANASAQGVAADAIGKSVSKSLEGSLDKVFGSKGSFGKTLQNAGLGYAAGSLTGSKTGGAIGGAIGGAVGKELLGSALGSLGQFAGPIGAIAGGLLGGAIGGMLKKTKTGAANITSVDGDATLSGNSSKFKAAASGAAGSVQDGLSSIADQLGGAIGSFNVTIGQRHGDWRVRTGTGSLKVAKGAKEFDDDQAGAIAYAIQLAVSQGAVTGLSAAVNKALKSSPDLDKALEEALKVSEIETLMGGLGAEIANEFKSFEATAKERVRIATQYGFDVAAIEKKNAEDRAALVESLLEEQVGSLQRLVDEMTSGSLFEGTALEQRDAILAEIEKAKADLAAGKDGASDTLASLFEQLNTVSKDAYGSTAQYAADRAMILDEARKAIAAANAQITAASAGSTSSSDPALATTNQALDENNDQNAELIALLKNLPAALANSLSNGTISLLDTASLARTS